MNEQKPATAVNPNQGTDPASAGLRFLTLTPELRDHITARVWRTLHREMKLARERDQRHQRSQRSA